MPSTLSLGQSDNGAGGHQVLDKSPAAVVEIGVGRSVPGIWGSDRPLFFPGTVRGDPKGESILSRRVWGSPPFLLAGVLPREYGRKAVSDTATVNKAAMRNGECRTTKRGARYCKKAGKVRFVKKGR